MCSGVVLMKYAVWSFVVYALELLPISCRRLRFSVSVRPFVLPPATRCSSRWLRPPPSHLPSYTPPVCTYARTLTTGDGTRFTITVIPFFNVETISSDLLTERKRSAAKLFSGDVVVCVFGLPGLDFDGGASC